MREITHGRDPKQWALTIADTFEFLEATRYMSLMQIKDEAPLLYTGHHKDAKLALHWVQTLLGNSFFVRIHHISQIKMLIYPSHSGISPLHCLPPKNCRANRAYDFDISSFWCTFILFNTLTHCWLLNDSLWHLSSCTLRQLSVSSYARVVGDVHQLSCQTIYPFSFALLRANLIITGTRFRSFSRRKQLIPLT